MLEISVVLVISGDSIKMANRVMGYVICGYNSVDNLMVSYFIYCLPARDSTMKTMTK